MPIPDNESPRESAAQAPHGHARSAFAALALGALGVVFGDIGTSPLYTLKECLHAAPGASHGTADLFGILSLIFWSLMMVVTVKYLTFIMRADHKGEGGIFALLAIVPQRMRERGHGRFSWLALLVVVGAALLYGDGAITPAISVLSAVEGLGVAAPALKPTIVPLTCGILVGLFAIQSRGTGAVGKLFGPVMALWFATIGALGVYHIAQTPTILQALLPSHALHYLGTHGARGGLILGSVVLAVTGGEALYADMGHFGARPIRWVWVGVVMPALVLCYLGQGALILRDPHALHNPFFAMVPTGPATFGLVLLSSVATVIASQALISGAFSLTRQAMQLGYFPRVTIKHTAHHTEGQIYVPEVNRLLAVGCLLLVLAFRASDRLASAYGIAVTGTMAITSVVFYVVARHTWHWSRARALPLLALFLVFDIPFFVANLFKFLDGGYVPVLIGVTLIAAMLVWSKGRTLLVEQYEKRFPTLEDALPRIRDQLVARVPGTAVFMSSSSTLVPPVLLHHVERGRVLHETVVLLTITTQDVAVVPSEERVTVRRLDAQFIRVIARVGFMEHPNAIAILDDAARTGRFAFDPETTTFYLGRETIVATARTLLGRLAEGLFAYLQRNAVAADREFGMPPRQVVEIGTQITL
jgi:KUP system potassium uptake protein